MSRLRRQSPRLLSLLAVSVGCGDGGGATGDGRLGPDGATPTSPVTETPVAGGAPATDTVPPAEGIPSSESPLGESTPLDDAIAPGGPAGDGSPSDPVTARPTEPPLGEDVADGWPVPTLEWAPCGNGFECALASVPRDYADPLGPQYRVAVTRRPAQDPVQRLGALFFNFGGPGSSAVATLRGSGGNGRFGTLNERFDLVAIDPRGTGASEGLIDCQVNQETTGLYGQPFFTPENLDVDAWTARAERYVEACVENDAGAIAVAATGNVARDMELVRRALGAEPLSYLGFSYGTFLGATYAALFPHGYRALVLDGALDPELYINQPTQALREQSAAFEGALQRFFEACAADPVACQGFGGDDPELAYDALVAEATLSPLPVPGTQRTLDGDDVLFATGLLLYDKGSWNTLAAALAALEDGNPAPLRQLTDAAYGRNADGTYDPAGDAYFVLGATEQTYATDLDLLRAGGEAAFAETDHFYSNFGYSELPYALFPIRSTGVFRGPFVAPADAATVLVVGTTFDPATPYSGSLALVEQLGNARLLTMQGDGHTAFGGNSACIDDGVEAYLLEGALPDVGAECEQSVPFGNPQNAAFTALDGPTAASARAVPVTPQRRQILYRGRWLEL